MAPSRPYDGCHGAGDALHHSAQRVEVPREEEEHAEYVGPRAQKAPPPGMRPAPLTEVAGPQGWPGTPSSPGAGVPSLAPPVLAGSAGEGVDSSALAFLATRALLDREEEEEAEELRVLEEKVATKEQRTSRLSSTLRSAGAWPGRWSCRGWPRGRRVRGGRKRGKRRSSRRFLLTPLVAALVVDNGSMRVISFPVFLFDTVVDVLVVLVVQVHRCSS